MDQDKKTQAAEAPSPASPAKKKEEKDPTVSYLVLGILGLVVAAVMLFLGIKTVLDQRLDPFDHSDIWDGYSQMDVVMLSEPFYEFTDGSTLHMAIDRNMAINVVGLTPELVEQLRPVSNTTLTETNSFDNIKPISVQGRHKEITAAMRHALVDAYNSMMNTDTMNYGRSSKVMGAIYLDATEPPTTRSPWTFLGLGSAVLVLSLYFVISAIVLLRRRRARSGHTTKEDPRLARYDVRVGYELQSGVALTAHAVVDLKGKDDAIELIPFRRILWMYSTRKNKSFGGSVQTIVLRLSDDTQREIASLPTAGAGNQIYLEIFSDIRDRVPGVLVGYSEDNEAAYREKLAELEGAEDEDDQDLDLLPQGDGTTNQITGQWQEGEDILPADWDPEAAAKAIDARADGESSRESK